MQGVFNKINSFIVVATISLMSTSVFAQNNVKARGVGISGGVLVGAETVLAIESLAKVKPKWAWWVFPILGAGAGGVGGYFVEKNSTPGAVALLLTGMAAVIPTTIAVVSTHTFDPDAAGAKPGDAEARKQLFSFEQDPTIEAETGSSQTHTEVEAKPEGVPEGPPAPVESTPYEQADDEDYEDYEDDDDDQDDVSSNLHDEFLRNKQLAHRSSGALFSLHPQYGLGLGIPAIDVFTAQLETPTGDIVQTGISVHFPLLSVRLP